MVKKIVFPALLAACFFTNGWAADYLQVDRSNLSRPHPDTSSSNITGYINSSPTFLPGKGIPIEGDFDYNKATPEGKKLLEMCGRGLPGHIYYASGPTIFDTPGLYEKLRPSVSAPVSNSGISQSTTTVRAVNNAVGRMPETARNYFMPRK